MKRRKQHMYASPVTQRALDRMAALGKVGTWLASAHGISFVLAAALGTTGISVLLPTYGQFDQSECMVRLASFGVVTDVGLIMLVSTVAGCVGLVAAYLPSLISYLRKARILPRGMKDLPPLKSKTVELIIDIQGSAIFVALVILFANVCIIIGYAKNHKSDFIAEHRSKIAAECPAASPPLDLGGV